jgi:putative ATPase
MLSLASYLRPTSFETFVGQKHIVGPEAPFYRLLQVDKLPHSFFFGPAGTGKTTLARLCAKELGTTFFEFNATSLKIEELRKVLLAHKNALLKPLVFIDEVHRLSKNQQEVMLPFMENSDAIFIGASTENPFFSLTSAIRSRSMLFEFHSHTIEDLNTLLTQVHNKEDFELSVDAKEYLLHSSGGDARAMLNLLECALNLEKNINIILLKSLRATTLNDGVSSSDTHYNLASALIKSVRGSDVDATIYYLARLIEGGESPLFIARRLLILASEDVGNANPNALTIATSCYAAVSKIGYPEARIILSQTALYLAGSPKSNASYVAINRAQTMIREGMILEVPHYLKDSHTIGHESGYRYPHDYGGWVEQDYLEAPLDIVELKESGYEAKMREWLLKLRGE